MTAPSPSRTFRRRPPGVVTRGVQVAGLVLVGYIGYLVVLQYQARVQLQESQLQLLAQGLDVRAGALRYFLDERVDDLQNLGASREIPSYFENLSLGMSMEYGLGASLHAIDDLFDGLCKRKQVGGESVYARIVLVDDGGSPLVTSGSPLPEGATGDLSRYLAAGDRDSISVDATARETHLVLSHPFHFKAKPSGRILAWVPILPVYSQFVAGRPGPDRIAVAFGEGYVVLPEDVRSILPAPLLSAPPPGSTGVSGPVPLRGGKGPDVFVIRVPVGSSPLSLVRFFPVTDLFEVNSARSFLLTTGGLALVILAGTFLLTYLSARNSALAIRLEEASFRQRAVDEKNRQLEAEVAERAAAEEALRASESRHRALLSAIPDVMFLQSPDGVFLDFHAREENHLLAPPETFLGRNMKDILPPELVARFLPLFERVTRGGGLEVLEYSLSRTGEERHFEARVVRCGTDRILSIIREVTERRRAQAEILEKQRRLDHLAHHDPLTGLPNRLLFQDRMQQAVARARRSGEGVSLLFFDLDRFKIVNDTLGHEVGDELLKAAAERLRQGVREEDTVARIGGDEFTIVLEGTGEGKDAATVARKLIESISAPFRVGNQELFVGTSVGITSYPADGLDSETLMRNADAALYQAKEGGRGTFRFFTEEMNERARRLLVREVALRHALARDQLALHYQPQVDARSGRITGAEALLRWTNPELGTISPSEFIPIAEETGLIVPIGEWVVRKACEQAVAWRAAGHAELRVAVNLSARQFRQQDLVESVLRVLADTGLEPRALELELTESALLQDVPSAIRVLTEFKKAGVGISIDDFGVGFSSLSYLKRLPLDTLKVAQEFVRDLFTEPYDAAIATAILSLGSSLGIRIIAEGVETTEQLEFFLARGCKTIQGFFYSRPVPAAEFERLLAGPGFPPRAPGGGIPAP